MKRFICLILFVASLLTVCACSNNEPSVAYNFYYPRADRGYNQQENRFYDLVIIPEKREDISYISARQMVTAYIQGPATALQSNPFPVGLELIAISIRNETLYLTFSDHLAELTGTDLIIACACLTKTCMELTSATTVQIRCETAMLDGNPVIQMNDSSLILSDSVLPAQEE